MLDGEVLNVHHDKRAPVVAIGPGDEADQVAGVGRENLAEVLSELLLAYLSESSISELPHGERRLLRLLLVCHLLLGELLEGQVVRVVVCEVLRVDFLLPLPLLLQALRALLLALRLRAILSGRLVGRRFLGLWGGGLVLLLLFGDLFLLFGCTLECLLGLSEDGFSDESADLLLDDLLRLVLDGLLDLPLQLLDLALLVQVDERRIVGVVERREREQLRCVLLQELSVNELELCRCIRMCVN